MSTFVEKRVKLVYPTRLLDQPILCGLITELESR
jgi:hypothetical protein